MYEQESDQRKEISFKEKKNNLRKCQKIKVKERKLRKVRNAKIRPKIKQEKDEEDNMDISKGYIL